MKAKAKEQLNRGKYNKKSRKEAVSEAKATKRELGALITIEAPLS